MVPNSNLAEYLRKQGLTSSGEVELEPLAGGVSGEVTLIRDANRRFVVKQALEKLKVKDEWLCDAGRNLTEYKAIEFVGRFLPESVPQLLHVDAEHNLFAMEYFGEEFVTWKQQLLNGNVNLNTARDVGRILATLHNRTWNAADAQSSFNSTNNFYDLRIEPYLVTTGKRHPLLKEYFEAEATRLSHARYALVHGDYSAKNILVSADRVVVLDWEVAWFGDPAFDSAFLLNLLLLKSLYHPERLGDLLRLIGEYRSSYSTALASYDDELDQRIHRLTLMLMLARIDGKSLVEYITREVDRQFVRDFVTKLLIRRQGTFESLTEEWQREVLSR